MVCAACVYSAQLPQGREAWAAPFGLGRRGVCSKRRLPRWLDGRQTSRAAACCSAAAQVRQLLARLEPGGWGRLAERQRRSTHAINRLHCSLCAKQSRLLLTPLTPIPPHLSDPWRSAGVERAVCSALTACACGPARPPVAAAGPQCAAAAAGRCGASLRSAEPRHTVGAGAVALHTAAVAVQAAASGGWQVGRAQRCSR